MWPSLFTSAFILCCQNYVRHIHKHCVYEYNIYWKNIRFWRTPVSWLILALLPRVHVVADYFLTPFTNIFYRHNLIYGALCVLLFGFRCCCCWVHISALKCSFAGKAPHIVGYKEYYKRYEVTDNHKVITTLFTIYA